MFYQELDYFRTVAKLENMSIAAKELHISQPGLSRSLTRLENELGVPMFDRRKGRIVLNTYGQIFLTNVNRAFDSLEYGVESVRQLYSRDQNFLAIACSLEDFLIDMLKAFSPEHPEIGIRQYSYSINEIELQLLRQNLDLAICAHPIKNVKIRYESLSSCPYVLVCNSDNPLSDREAVYLKEVSGERFICDNSRLDRKQLEMICREHGFAPVISHEIDNSHILYDLLATNTCINLLPIAHYLKIENYYKNHHLRAIRLKDNLPKAEIGVAYLPERYLSTSAKLFIDFLREWMNDEQISIDNMPASRG